MPESVQSCFELSIHFPVHVFFSREVFLVAVGYTDKSITFLQMHYIFGTIASKQIHYFKKWNFDSQGSMFVFDLKNPFIDLTSWFSFLGAGFL